MSFAKLDSGIVDSTLWMQPHDVLRVWIAIMAKASATGYVRASVPSMAHLCMVPIERLEQILAILTSPDPYSRTPDDDGRRLRAIEGGWQIINYLNYRNARDTDAERERKREWDRQHRPSGHARGRQPAEAGEPEQGEKSDDSPTQSDAVRRDPTSPTQAEAEAEADTEKANTNAQRSASRFDEFWQVYPKRVGRKPSLEKWKAKKLDALADTIIADVRSRIENDGRWLDGYIPDPRTYLTQERWTDELQPRRSAPQSEEAPSRTASPSPAKEESPLEKKLNWIRHQRDWLQSITPEDAEKQMVEVRAKFGAEAKA